MGFLKFIVGLIIISGISIRVIAQEERTDCEQTLAMATEEFNSGRFYGIPSLLKPCVDRGFSREQKQRAFLLLAQTYLLLDDPISAENSYLEVLRANPEFETDTALHPIDLVYLSKKFTADPIFAVFAKVGGNTSPVRVIQTVSPSGQPVNNEYGLRPGFQIGGGVDYNFTRFIAISAEAEFGFTSYKKTQTRFSDDLLELTANQSWATIPVYVKYTFTKGNFRPYGYGGLAVHFLNSENGKFISQKRDLSDLNPVILPEKESTNRSLMEFRNTFNRSILIGGGVRYKYGLDYFFVDVRYYFGLSNIVSSSSSADYTGVLPELGHADDMFRMDNLSISFGYYHPFYNPRKLKQARTKSVLRGINKSSK
ncbi:MAG: PorT family protein [Cyclobacteriaceae bacterium]|nr:PorT family protein [Cyclobacteriaceae bacterium]